MEKLDNIKKMYEAFMKTKKEHKEEMSRDTACVDYTLPDGKLIERS